MSTNFSGVTFAQQRVTPIDDAIIRRAILPDGILTGCRLSYSGSTLTMAAGQMVICGRQIRHAASQNWAVVGATSGYARLLLTIDLTRTATKEVFDQVVDTIEYASSLDGFLALEQADINAAGTKYQVPICVVSLGAGGITGIVSQLEPASAGILGGLNFNLVGGVTQPADPKGNTIWVNTNDKITGWALSFGAPAEPYEGMVWIVTGTRGRNVFNALKKNTLAISPMSAKQYVNGAWQAKEAQIYIDGEWRDFVQYLVKAGVPISPLKLMGKSYNSSYQGEWTSANSTPGDGFITVAGASYGYGIACVEDVDLTAFTTLTIEGNFKRSGVMVKLIVWDRLGTYITDNMVRFGELPQGAGTLSLDVSGLTGPHIVGISSAAMDEQQIANFWLE